MLLCCASFALDYDRRSFLVSGTAPLRLALCNEVIRDLSFERQCAFARAVGYDGLEVAPFTLDSEPHLIDDARICALRATATEHGIAITGLHWLLSAPQGLSITSEDDATFQRTVEVGRRLVALCAALGGTYVVHGSPPQRRLAEGREAEGRRRAIAYFVEMAKAAEAAGIDYCLEALAAADTRFITSVDEALAIVAEIGSPALATMIDCSATARNGDDIPALIRRTMPGGQIRHVHVNDPNLRGPGEGALAFAPVVAALRDCGYQGMIGVEPFVYEPDGPACAARAAGYMRGLLER